MISLRYDNYDNMGLVPNNIKGEAYCSENVELTEEAIVRRIRTRIHKGQVKGLCTARDVAWTVRIEVAPRKGDDDGWGVMYVYGKGRRIIRTSPLEWVEGQYQGDDPYDIEHRHRHEIRLAAQGLLDMGAEVEAREEERPVNNPLLDKLYPTGKKTSKWIEIKKSWLLPRYQTKKMSY